jgi:tetratricopeptide (TPR) repeat protein
MEAVVEDVNERNEGQVDVNSSIISEAEEEEENADEEKEEDDLVTRRRKKALRRVRRQKKAALILQQQPTFISKEPVNKKLQNFPPYVQATDYLKGRLEINNSVSRYTHLIGTLAEARGNIEEADQYFRRTILMAPNNVMARNDFALHLGRLGQKDDCIKELNKAELIASENSLLHKNLGAAYGKRGDFELALQHATRSRFLAPNDAMNHRNIAKLHSALGDTHSALHHNLQSIQLEDPHKGYKPNTSAYRAAAVQIITTQRGTKEDAVALIDAARRMEGKKLELSTTERTFELIDRIKQQQGDRFKDLERRKEEEIAKRQASVDSWKQMLDNMKNI